MNRKSPTAACRSPERTKPRLLTEYRAPAATACSHAEAGSTHHARPRSDREPLRPGGPRFGQPERPTREWSGRSAQTRGQDRQDYGQHGRGRPSVGEIPANTLGVFLASAAPLAKASGCPPNRVNPRVAVSSAQRTRYIEPLPSVGGCRIRRLPMFGGATLQDRCGQAALRPTARARTLRPGHPSIGPWGRSRPRAGRRPLSDSGRRCR